MQVRAAPTASRGETFRQHAHNFVEFRARKVSEWIGGPDHLEQCIFCPFLWCNRGDNLLRQDIERLFRNFKLVELASTNCVEQRCAFNQFIARQRKHTTLWITTDRMVGTPDAL